MAGLEDDWSDVVVRSFALEQAQADLKRDEGAHCHMKEDLPHVAQFVQVHIAQADEGKRQEGLDVPPHRVVGKQVTLERERRGGEDITWGKGGKQQNIEPSWEATVYATVNCTAQTYV